MSDDLDIWKTAVSIDAARKGAKIIEQTALPGGGYCIIAKGGGLEIEGECERIDHKQFTQAALKASISHGRLPQLEEIVDETSVLLDRE